MKCDELKPCTYDDMIDGDADINIEYYPKSEVDAAIAELQSENAELKKKLMPCLNGDCILTCEVIEKYGKENAELKAKLDKAIAERDGNQVCIDALKQKLENVQASMYADVLDANMENRRLKRALYKACANWAHHRVFVRFKFNEKAWENVERKCLKKAEEYK